MSIASLPAIVLALLLSVASALAGTPPEVLKQCRAPGNTSELITAEEASRKPDPELPARSLFSGPDINGFGPREREIAFPIDLTVELKPYAGAEIKLESLEVTYLKSPSKNLVPYLCKSMTAKEDKTVTFGFYGGTKYLQKHLIRVRVKDTRKFISEKYLEINVTRQESVTTWSWELKSPATAPWLVDLLKKLLS